MRPQNTKFLRKIGRLFVIKTKWETSLIVYALALGAVERGKAYLTLYPGYSGQLLFVACLATVAMAGAKLFDCIRLERTGG